MADMSHRTAWLIAIVAGLVAIVLAVVLIVTRSPPGFEHRRAPADVIALSRRVATPAAFLTGRCRDLPAGVVFAGNSSTVSSYGNRVQADSIDINTVNNYGNRFSVTGHCGSLKVSAYHNQVQVDGVDTVDVSGYSNTVTYHSG
jgi:hypothetical protein